jgi:hypothetical protein
MLLMHSNLENQILDDQQPLMSTDDENSEYGANIVDNDDDGYSESETDNVYSGNGEYMPEASSEWLSGEENSSQDTAIER